MRRVIAAENVLLTMGKLIFRRSMLVAEADSEPPVLRQMAEYCSAIRPEYRFFNQFSPTKEVTARQAAIFPGEALFNAVRDIGDSLLGIAGTSIFSLLLRFGDGTSVSEGRCACRRPGFSQSWPVYPEASTPAAATTRLTGIVHRACACVVGGT